jgi:hypothetical protein
MELIVPAKRTIVLYVNNLDTVPIESRIYQSDKPL